MKFSRTLRYRLTAWYCFALTLVLITFGILLYGLVHYHLLHHHDEPLRASASAVLKILSEQDDCHDLTVKQLEKLHTLGRLALIHEDGGQRTVFFKSPELTDGPVATELTQLPLTTVWNPQFDTLQVEGSPWRVLSLPYKTRSGRNGVIRVVEDLGDITEIMEALRLGLLLLTPIGLLISSFAGFWLSGKALAPLGRVTAMAQEIEASHLDLRLPHPGEDSEIGRLVDTLNRMLDRLNKSFESIKRFTADASHELRSPLTTMGNTIDAMLDRPRTVEEHQATLQSLGEEVVRLSAIVEDLLLLARADAGRFVMRMEPVRFDKILEDQVEAHLSQARESGIDLRIQTSGPALILGDERWIHQLVENLLSNALKFTPGPGVVTASLFQAEAAICLVVEDSGPGIPEGDLQKVFERFFRSDPSRSRHHALGSGLGLAITAWIADAHGAAIKASNRPEGGGVFTVLFKSHGKVPE